MAVITSMNSTSQTGGSVSLGGLCVITVKSSPKAIRISGNSVDANLLKVTFQQIKITKDSDVLLDLAAHLATLPVGEADIGVILPCAKSFQKESNKQKNRRPS